MTLDHARLALLGISTATPRGLDVEVLPFLEDRLFLIIRQTLEVLVKSSEDLSI